MGELDQADGSASPAIADAPRLARRTMRWRTEALSSGFDAVGLRSVRETTTSVCCEANGASSVGRRSERRLEAEVARGGRTSTLSTTDLSDEQVRSELSSVRTFMERGAPELFGAPVSSRLEPAPVGPFDGLSLTDPTLVRPESDVLLGYAEAISRPATATVAITARTRAEAVARTDGGLVAVRHTRVDVDVHTDHGVMRRSARFWIDLPRPSEWTEMLGQLAMLRLAEPTRLPDAPVRMIVHPSAGPPLVRALVALPLRTQRLSSRLTIWSDPWVSRGVGSLPFDRHGQATLPLPLLEGGLQRRRWLGPGAQPGNLRVSRGGRSLDRLLRESDDAVLVRHWHTIEVEPDSGRMQLVGCGWRVLRGERVHPLPTIVLRGSVPALFGSLVQVGREPYIRGLAHTPALVFEPVRLTAD
ncbi:MAG: hypothetical protein CL927_09420 [Deltaproteobacteria bacterium]|mgnify:CR=1 FL=1|nr:hypothetical protein [Deltaproteobacteria bacterium]HCH64784.1 hypothetical protein [Deltaproteobacteria bacterium]